MKISFLGAAHEVTGSCTLLEVNNYKILIDCGMEQGPDTYKNITPPINANEIDFVLLTHAHIDHSGKLPKLVKDGFKNAIYTSEATVELCNIMLKDSAHIQESEAENKNRKNKRSGKQLVEPEYTLDDVEATLKLFVGCSYNEYYDINDSITVKFIDAGHLLGSASIEIIVKENNEEKTLLFSGDIGNVDRPLIRNPQKPTKADIVVIESTYGDRVHHKRSDYKTQLTEIIQKTLDKGGNLVVPSFAIGRTQELLYLIRQIKKEELVKNHDHFKVWVDSPLAVEATSIYDGGLMDYYDEETLDLIKKGEDVLRFKDVEFSRTSEESKMLNEDKTPKVILSASGMCEAGRIRHHLKHNLYSKKNTILFVGYQAVGTLGRVLLDGAKTIKMFGENIDVKADIEVIEGISGHADKNMLIDWLSNIVVKPKMVFVNHGDDLVVDSFKELIESELSIKAVAPYNGAEYDLNTLTCLKEGNKELISKKKQIAVNMSKSYNSLLLAENYLNTVINQNKHGANRNLELFAKEIKDLADRWSGDTLK